MPNSKNIKPSGKKFTFTDMTALLKPHLRAVFPGLRFPASISALERASYPAGRSPNSSFLFPPLAAVVAVAPKGRASGEAGKFFCNFVKPA